MTLREMRAAYPHLFHPNQDWFEEEEFLDISPRVTDAPFDCATVYEVPASHAKATAADLAALYVADPTLPMWRFYLWTCDRDRYGQQVYVGDNGKGFEIHRHIHLTDRFGVPVWS